MTTVLHILTRPADELTTEIIERHQNNKQITTVIVDLTKASDYNALLESIFAADSVASW